MGCIYINNKIVTEKIEKEKQTAEQANTLLELAQKEARIKKLEEENATIMLELATLKGGM